MTADEKLAQINAKDFTYVQVFFDTHNAHKAFDPENPWVAKFVVLTPSRPEAMRAAKAIIAQRWTHAPVAMRNGREEIHLYPRNYVRDAKALVASAPDRVYAVDSTTTVSVSA